MHQSLYLLARHFLTISRHLSGFFFLHFRLLSPLHLGQTLESGSGCPLEQCDFLAFSATGLLPRSTFSRLVVNSR